MAITVRMAAQLGGLRHSNLVAGENGLDRLIGWVDVLEVPDASLWLKENLLLITTCYAVRDNPEGQLDILRAMSRSGAAALAVKFGRFIGQAPPEMIRLANELAIPLFDVPDGISFMDITHPVMSAIINSQAKQFYKRDLLEDLINGSIVSREQALLRAATVDLRLDEPYVIFVADVDGFTDLLAGAGEQQEHVANQVKSQLLSVAEECFMRWPNKAMVVSRSDSIIGVVALGTDYAKRDWRGRLKKIGEQLQAQMRLRWKDITITVSIGTPITEPTDFAAEYRAARQSVRLTRRLHGKGRVVLREDMELYCLLDNIGAPLENFCRNALSAIDNPKVRNSRELLETLEAYIECRGNMALAAQKLFIHRNTMRYRLENIHHLLGSGWDEADGIFKLWVALRVRKMLK